MAATEAWTADVAAGRCVLAGPCGALSERDTEREQEKEREREKEYEADEADEAE